MDQCAGATVGESLAYQGDRKAVRQRYRDAAGPQHGAVGDGVLDPTIAAEPQADPVSGPHPEVG